MPGKIPEQRVRSRSQALAMCGFKPTAITIATVKTRKEVFLMMPLCQVLCLVFSSHKFQLLNAQLNIIIYSLQAKKAKGKPFPPSLPVTIH